MKVHYFQRYSSKENVATNNTLLLLSRLYSYSPGLFHSFLGGLAENSFTKFDTEISFEQQVSSDKSVPDGQILQRGFNVVIEAKIVKKFDINQIKNHLSKFKETEEFQIMLTLSPFELELKQNEEIKQIIKDENKKVKHIHTTFKEIIEKFSDVIDGNRDFEMNDILEDYREYCSKSKLLSNAENLMRAVLTGATFEDNLDLNLYYDPKSRGYSDHKYIALYKEKAIKAIGEIYDIVEAELIDNKLKIITHKKEISDKQVENIKEAMIRAEKYNYDITADHKFFLVKEFHKTLYEKKTSGPLRGKKFFDITNILPNSNVKSVSQLAEMLLNITW
ncbi:hypothetical protein QUF55_04380 [Clostridiaceae bacterium HSG29]|nr:hypothetical protein [Clostridiaceae bacterium HSG29]